MIAIIDATEEHIPVVRDLFLEYSHSLDFDLCFQNFDEEIRSLPGEYSSPDGCILLAYEGTEAVGCVALRPLESQTAEMKHLYVRQTHQGQGIGRALAKAIVEKAAQADYKQIRLDTVSSMKAAIHTYRSLGF